MQRAAILTGDLIGSTTAAPEATASALAILGQAAEEIGAWVAGPSPHPPRFTRFRGDGWQFSAPFHLGPRAVLQVTAALTAAGGLQSRIALGLGLVEDWGGATDLSAARGAALTASGRALDAMRPGQVLALASLDPGPDPRDLALMTLWAAMARGWTREQAEVLALSLHPDRPRQTALAARLGISPQAVSQRLRGAEAEALLQSLGLWESAISSEERPPR